MGRLGNKATIIPGAGMGMGLGLAAQKEAAKCHTLLSLSIQ
jgi:hypothetical protein